LPVPSSYKTHNVATELKDPRSVLSFYKQILSLRHSNSALLDGEYIALNQDDPNVLSYLRGYKDDAILVVLNMSGTQQRVTFDLTAQGYPAAQAKTLLTTRVKSPSDGHLQQVSLEPFEMYIASVSK